MNIVLGFFAVTFFARQLGADRLGQFFTFQAVLSVLALVSDLGINGAVEKRLSESGASDEIVSAAVALKLVPLFVGVGGIFFFRGYLTQYVDQSLLFPLIVGTILSTYTNMFIEVLNGELRVEETAAVRLSKQVVWVGLGTILVTLGFGVTGIVYALLTAQATQLLYGAIRSSASVAMPAIKQFRSLGSFARHNYLTTLGHGINEWLDVLLLRLFAGEAAVAAYEVAWRVSSVLMLPTRAFATNIIPRISSWYGRQRVTDFSDFVGSSIVVALLPVVPGVFGLIILGEEILKLVFGTGFGFASTALIVLAGGRAAEAVGSVYARLMSATEYISLTARISFAALFTNVVANLVFIPWFGVVGASIGTSLGFLVGTALSVVTLPSDIGVKFPVTEVGTIGVCSLVMFGVLGSLTTEIDIESLPILVALVVVGILVYSVGVLLSTSLRERLYDAYRLFTDDDIEVN
ncbi:polysaccharide biosynthesis C-terminal domain-containing protein [Haloplanus salinarum]|uniref:oligosaccharide flippase family protein n=1 Tax=Haloplanus salinarum TaxID=1912324 RepID=UPI003B428391